MKRRAADALGRLYVLYHETNILRFSGLLPAVPIFIRPNVRRARTAGRVMIAYTETNGATGSPRQIVVLESHALSSPWSAVKDTMLHEMIHVWQAQRGEAPGHGDSFRQMARQLRISDRACE